MRRAAAADFAGITGCLELCERSGRASKTVKSLAVSAVIGAVWKDSHSLDAVKRVLARLKYVLAGVNMDRKADKQPTAQQRYAKQCFRYEP